MILEKERCQINIRFIDPSAEAYERFYGVISNPLLWFLQHSIWDIARSPALTRKPGWRGMRGMFLQPPLRGCRG